MPSESAIASKDVEALNLAKNSMAVSYQAMKEAHELLINIFVTEDNTTHNFLNTIRHVLNGIREASVRNSIRNETYRKIINTVFY